MDCNPFLVRNNFIVRADISCHEVDENVDDEHDVDDCFHHDKTV